MRKLLLILLLIPFFADAQVWQQNNLEYGHQFKGLKALRAFLLPLAETTVGQGRDTGAVYYRLADSSLYVYTGSQWRQVTGSGGGSQDLQSVTDIGNFTTGGVRAGSNLTIRNTTNTTTLGEWINNSNSRSELYIYNTSTGRQAMLANNLLEFKGTGSNYQAIKPHASSSAAYVSFTLPNTAIDRYIPTTFKLNGTTVAAGDTGLVDLGTVSGSTILNNVGTGFDLAQQGTDNVKRLAMGYGFIADSTSTTVTLRADTLSLMTIAQGQHRIDSLAANSGVAVQLSSGTFAQRPASPDTGAIYYQTDLLVGEYIYDGTYWNFHGPASRYIFGGGAISLYGLGSNVVSGAGAAVVLTNADGRSVYNTYSTGTTSAGYAITEYTTGVVELDSVVIYSEYDVMLPVLSDGTDSYYAKIGMIFNNSTGGLGVIANFSYTHSDVTGNWRCISNNAGYTTTTYTDSGIPVVANQWYRLGVETDGFNRTVKYYIDNVLVQTHTTAQNVPFPNTVAALDCYGGVSILKTAGTTNRTLLSARPFAYYTKKKYE